MKTPICDFVKGYAKSDCVRMHMPGHKGKNGIEALDITEINGADVLYSASGIIRESEENAASLFGSGKTLYSTEGSSLSIRAMLYLALLHARSLGKPQKIAAGRNAHKTFVSAAALLDFDIDWLYSDGDMLSCSITAASLEKYFSATVEKPSAVYVTSPDYLGNLLDISALASVCHAHGAVLLVDNAHGAYLRFLREDMHPITLGADMCCDSAHKTLPVLTGGGYLHISKNAPRVFHDGAENALSLFASTSPSYLLLQSLDAANKYIADGYRTALCEFAEAVSALKNRIAEHGYTLFGDEPLKITVAAKAYGYTGDALAAALEKMNIICEFCDSDYLVLMLTPSNSECDLEALETALCSIKKAEPITVAPPQLPTLTRAVSLHEAITSPCEEIDVERAAGRVLASPSVLCPPAIPIAVCGERLDDRAIACFKYYGIKKCRVLCEN